MRWAQYVASMREIRGAYRVLARRLERRIPHEKPRRRWEDNKIDFKKWDGARSGLIWLRLGTYGGLLKRR